MHLIKAHTQRTSHLFALVEAENPGRGVGSAGEESEYDAHGYHRQLHGNFAAVAPVAASAPFFECCFLLLLVFCFFLLLRLLRQLLLLSASLAGAGDGDGDDGIDGVAEAGLCD